MLVAYDGEAAAAEPALDTAAKREDIETADVAVALGGDAATEHAVKTLERLRLVGTRQTAVAANNEVSSTISAATAYRVLTTAIRTKDDVNDFSSACKLAFNEMRASSGWGLLIVFALTRTLDHTAHLHFSSRRTCCSSPPATPRRRGPSFTARGA